MIAKEEEPAKFGNPVSNPKVVKAELGTDAPQWMVDLDRDGWAVVKGAVDPQKAQAYADRAHEWLEGFKLGYKRDDPSTWHKEKLPRHDLGGLYAHYSIAHAQFVWDIKSEPGIVSLFEQIWGTDKLTVSFDGGNLAVPLPKSEIDNGAAPWPHTDQSPLKPDLASIQGLLNLLPNGEDDGGLTVMTGSANLFPDVWQAFELDQPEQGWPKNDNIRYKDSWLQWLEARGCRIVKPCLDPGDFILWDSRCVHWGQAPLGGKHRFAVYVCYKPFDWMDDEAKKKKLEYFEKGYCTSHDPITFVVKSGQEADWNIAFPYGRPELSEQCKKAVGLEAY